MRDRTEDAAAEEHIGCDEDEDQAGGAERQLSPKLLETLCLTQDTVRSPAL